MHFAFERSEPHYACKVIVFAFAKALKGETLRYKLTFITISFHNSYLMTLPIACIIQTYILFVFLASISITSCKLFCFNKKNSKNFKKTIYFA